MKTLSLIHPKNPDCLCKGDWEKLSKDILHRLHSDFEVNNDPELCGVTLGDFLQDRQLKDLAVMVMGNDWPSSQLFLMKLRLKGDGACPKCGSDCIQIIDGPYNAHPEDGEIDDPCGHVCDQCGNDWIE